MDAAPEPIVVGEAAAEVGAVEFTTTIVLTQVVVLHEFVALT